MFRMPVNVMVAVGAASVLGTAVPAAAQSTGQTNQDRLGAVVGALFGDRLGLSTMDQAWLRGGRPLRDGQSQFSTRVDASVRSGAVTSSAATRLRSDYTALVDLETRYAADGAISVQERTDLNTRYNSLIQTLETGAAGYGAEASVGAGRAAFDARVDAAVTARRITRTEATRLKADYQALIRVETGYLADGALSAAEQADLDTRLDALDVRVGDGPATSPVAQTPRARLTALETAVATAERAGRLSSTDAAHIRVEAADLTRLEIAYGRYAASADETAYLIRRIGELETRARR